MLIADRIQAFVHNLEMDAGRRWLNYMALALAVTALAVWYDTHCYVGFNTPEAMDAAQVARNLSEGRGFTTGFIRPFSIHLLQEHHRAHMENADWATNAAAAAELSGRHPDLANPPLYPLVLAALLKLGSPEYKVELHETFWSEGGQFMRYKPEFLITIFNQFLLLVAVWLTFLLARTLFDVPAAWLAAVLMLCSDQFWKFSISGLPVLLLLVIFLGLVWCLTSFEALDRLENPEPRRRFKLAVAAGLLAGLGMLTRYSFGWVIVPAVIFLLQFGGERRKGLAVTAFLVFGLTVSPWLLRNLAVSGTIFGTAGYAVVEETFAFPGSMLMQSLTPDLDMWNMIRPCVFKLISNLGALLNELPKLGGGWMGILFLAGLLLGLRNVAARRLRYFAMTCLGVFLVVSALGRTHWSVLDPELNGENLLVLLTPLAVIFGVAFFVTLLIQMNVPTPATRYAVVVLVVLLVRLQFIQTLLPPRTSTVAWPPYYPPDIQKVSAWMQPDELMMSDLPWAVAWYGDRQCSWTTLNCKYEFVALNDFIKPVGGLYLGLNTLDGRLVTDCLHGNVVDNWNSFVFNTLAHNKIPDKFPLTQSPLESLRSSIFLADRQRW